MKVLHSFGGVVVSMLLVFMFVGGDEAVFLFVGGGGVAPCCWFSVCWWG
jgi:hypothetical protein